MATAEEVGAWMHAEFERDGRLGRAAAVEGICARFGEEFIVAGGIRRDVLETFRRLGRGGLVWVARTQGWRRRNAADPPFRGQVRGE